MNTNNQEEIQEFSRYIIATSEYYHEDLSPSSVKIWINGLQNYSLQDIRQAIDWYIKNADNGQFMPHIKDITKIIDGDLNAKAAKAWTTADKALRTRGPYENIKFQDPIIMLVIRDMGGWIKFCTGAKDDNYPFVQKDFERRYRDYAMHPLPMNTPKKLTGIAHQSNSQSHKQNNRIQGKTTEKLGYDAVMAKIRSYGLKVDAEPEPEQQQQQQVASHEAP